LGASCTDTRESCSPHQKSLLEEESRVKHSKKPSVDIVEKDPVDENMVDKDPVDENMVDKDTVDEDWEDSEKKAQQLLDVPNEESKSPTTKVPVREEKHIFTLTFRQPELGLVVNSDDDSNCAYVTVVDEDKNPMLKDVELPKHSKVLQVNGVDVEILTFPKIVDSIKEGKKHLPLTITFCHPDGLGENEVPDLNPLTIMRSSSNLN